MKATELTKTLQHIVETEGDLDVDVSVAKLPESELPKSNQQYLVGDARFIVVEEYDDPKEKRISIRDWPY